MNAFQKIFEIPTGEYTATQTDLDKSLAAIRIVDAGGTYTVRSRVALSGRGITARPTPGSYEVSKAAMRRLEKEHSVVCDF